MGFYSCIHSAHIDIIKNAMAKRGTTMKGNRNTKRVTVKANRNCWHCNKIIPKGTVCLTVNPKGYGRHWLCKDCISLYNSIIEAKCSLDSVPFDDEGAAYANADYLDEKVSEWEGCQYGEDTILDKRVYSLVD